MARARRRRRRSAPGRHLPGRAAGRHQRRARSSSGSSASGFTRVQAEREVASPTGPRKVLDVVADRFRLAGDREGARGRGDRDRRSSAAAAASTSTSLRGGRRRAAPDDSGASRPACTAPTATCRYADPQPALFSFNSAVRRLRDLPRLRPRDRRRPTASSSPTTRKTLRAGAIKTVPDAGLEGVPGRPDEVRRRGRHPARHRLDAAHRGAARRG